MIFDELTTPYYESAHRVVFGIGNPNASIMIIGEAPGEQEDAVGIPFVGDAGKLLTKMLEAAGLYRCEIYLTNVVKDRPPDNETPSKEAIEYYKPFLFKEIRAVNPGQILCLGTVAAQTVLDSEKTIGQLRAENVHYVNGTNVIVTYHPSYLLRKPSAKAFSWQDLQMLTV